MPRQEGQIVQSPVINVRDPVLPIGTNLSIVVAVPPPSKVSQASYNFFDFVSKSVFIICATTCDNTCKEVCAMGKLVKTRALVLQPLQLNTGHFKSDSVVMNLKRLTNMRWPLLAIKFADSLSTIAFENGRSIMSLSIHWTWMTL